MTAPAHGPYAEALGCFQIDGSHQYLTLICAREGSLLTL